MNLHQIDLNLLVLFDALYQHRSVSLAAQKVCISQSAFSHGLSRLRSRLNDQLFVRINNVMQPTPRAIELAGYISCAFPLLEQGLIYSSDFDPSTSDITYRLVATDYTEFCLLPKLMQHLEKVAPNIRLEILPASQLSPNEQLEDNSIDFVLGYTHQTFSSSTVEHFTWLNESYCTMTQKSHVAVNGNLSLDKFLSLSHILIAPWGEKQGVVDQTLAAKKLKRKIALQLPSLFAAPHVVEQTGYLLTLPKLIASQMSEYISCDIYAPPIDVPDYQLNIYWHKLNSERASFKWLVTQIKQLF